MVQRKDVVVLRAKSLTSENLYNIINFAQSKTSTAYSLKEALKVAQTQPPKVALEPNRQFCTRFVAQAMASANLNIVENPDYCSPQDIPNSEKLIQIIYALKSPNAEESNFALGPNPFTIQKNLLPEHFKNVREISDHDIQTQDQINQFLINHPELHDELARLTQESSTLEDWKYNFENSPELYINAKFMEKYTVQYQQWEVWEILKKNEPILHLTTNSFYLPQFLNCFTRFVPI